MPRNLAIADVLPGAVIALATLVSAIPWGLPAEAAFVLPLAAAGLAMLYSAEARPALPPWFLFLAGLLIDLLTAGPLGYWALLFLMAYVAGRASRGLAEDERWLALWLAFAFALAVLATVGWAIAALYFMLAVDWRPVAVGAVVVTAVYPLLARMSETKRAARLRRRGRT